MPLAPRRHRPAGADRQPVRVSAARRGYGRAWQKARAWFLLHHPLCAEHALRGETEAATVVDHIRPHKGDPQLFWDKANWQPLCKPCHDRKTATGDMQTARPLRRRDV